MKYKRLGLIALIPMLFIALLGQGYVVPAKRYHQHREANQKPPCSLHGSEKFCTHLPLINIVTDGPIPAPFVLDENGVPLRDKNGHTTHVNDMVSASVEIFDNPYQNNHLDDTPAIQSKAFIRARGNSSRHFDKQSYLLHFVEDDLVKKKDVSVCGMSPDNSWVLHGPFVDRSLIRNYLCYNIAGEMMSYSPNVRFCEIFLNGDFHGLYLLTEKIKRSDFGRIHMSKSDPDLVETPYIVQIDRGRADAQHIIHPLSYYAGYGSNKGSGFGHFEITYPNETLTPNQKKYIENKISAMEHALYSFDYAHPERGYRNFIDVNSFVNFYLMNEWSANKDAMSYSTFLYQDPRGKMKLVVWDFDLSFNLNLNEFLKHGDIWYKRLMMDPYFVRRVTERYKYLRKHYLSDEYLMKYIDDTLEYLGPAVQRDWDRWGNTANNFYFYNILARDIPHTQEESIQQLKDAVLERSHFMDDNLDKLQHLCHESVNKIYNVEEKRRFK